MFNSLPDGETFLFTSESVGEGHPDKLCDIISDSVLDASLEQDPFARVACEVAVKNNRVFLFGELTGVVDIDFERIAKDAIASVGYDDPEKGMDHGTCAVTSLIEPQSSEIAEGIRATRGAGDQGIMFGYAVDETESLMPLTIELAHRITRKIKELGQEVSIGPDCKSQVTVQYRMKGGVPLPVAVPVVVVSVQHHESIRLSDLRALIEDRVIREAVPEELLTGSPRFLINPCGSFRLGGPAADAGLTGRKIIVDTYGGWAPHGGGSFSGKDGTKVDRSGAYIARRIAKSLVRSGICKRVLVQLSYAIGVANPVSVTLFSFGTSELSDREILTLIREHFDLRPSAIIDALTLRKPGFRPTATFGHFGHDDYPWERPIHLSTGTRIKTSQSEASV